MLPEGWYPHRKSYWRGIVDEYTLWAKITAPLSRSLDKRPDDAGHHPLGGNTVSVAPNPLLPAYGRRSAEPSLIWDWK